MRLVDFILFAFVVFFSPTSCIALELADHDIKAQNHPRNTMNRAFVASGTNTTDKLGNEDRVIQIPRLSTIAEMAMRISPRYQGLAQSIWLKGRTDPKVVFQALNLGGTLLKLDDNPRVLQWLKYVKAYNVAGKRKGIQFSDDDIYQLLSKNTDNGELAVLFYSLKSNPAFKSLGESMAKVVFNDWLRKEVRPEKVMIQLELIGNRASDIPDHTLRSKIHRDYVFMFTNELNLRAYYKTQLDKLFGK